MGAIFLLYALCGIFIGSCADRMSKRIKWYVLVAGVCALLAIIIFVAGGSDCLSESSTGLDNTSIGASIIVDIVVAVVCFAAVGCLHSEYGAEGPGNQYNKM